MFIIIQFYSLSPKQRLLMSCHVSLSFVCVCGGAGVTLRSNSVKRSSRRRARRVSAGMNEDVLATDSGVFEAWSRRSECHS